MVSPTLEPIFHRHLTPSRTLQLGLKNPGDSRIPQIANKLERTGVARWLFWTTLLTRASAPPLALEFFEYGLNTITNEFSPVTQLLKEMIVRVVTLQFFFFFFFALSALWQVQTTNGFTFLDV